jgi:hypothetical protein
MDMWTRAPSTTGTFSVKSAHDISALLGGRISPPGGRISPLVEEA